MPKLFLGFDANHRKLYLEPKDRASHMHVIGSSGSGKSKFLEWMIRQDIKNGQGLCLIDPHGTLYEDIVQWAGYNNLTGRKIILFDPSGNRILGFNPFKQTEGDISVQVDYQITATLRAWNLENTDETPTLERWLRCIFHTLIEKQQNISEAGYLVQYYENTVRDYLTADLNKPIIQSEWQELAAAKTPKQFQDELRSTRNKLFRLLTSDQILRVMGLIEPTLDIRQIMDEGHILLVNLAESDNLSHENARLLGSLLVNEFFQHAKRRKKDQWGNPPKPFYFYIDEFQNYVTPDISYILDQARKRGLFLVMAHQRFGQVKEKAEDVVEAVLTNAKTKAVFGGLTRANARRMVEEMFTNQLDLKEIKKAIYQTKFWPEYARDKVYVSSQSHTTADATSVAASMGSSSHYAEGEGWFAPPVLTSTADSQVSAESESHVEADTHGEAEIDIPIFIPVPFQELSSVQYWSLEEQIWRTTDALKEQFPRHCFIKTPNQKTQPMLVPLVKEYRVSQASLDSFQNQLHSKTRALPKAQVDQLLEEKKQEIQLKAKAQQDSLVEYPTKFKQPRKKQ